MRERAAEPASYGEGQMLAAAAVASAIDAAVTEPVLVVGSPPPTGRDLDLLATRGAHTAIVAWLTEANFLPVHKVWASFEGPTPYGVDLSSTEVWESSSYDPARLFRDAEPMPGYRHLVRPGPATVLLLAARGIAARRGGLSDKSRARVASALQHDPEAWSTAEREARALGLVGAVRLLRKSYGASQPLSPAVRAAAMAGIWRHKGPIRAKAKVFIAARPRYSRPMIVSLSGLDGAGKSTQVTGLRDTLNQLGCSASVQWAGFSNGKRLHAALSSLDRWTHHPAPQWSFSDTTPGRERFMPAGFDASPLRQHFWVFTIVTINAGKLWQHVLRPRRATRVLIFDRFSPDAAVKLDYHYRHVRNLDIRWQAAYFRLVSPKPHVGFLLEIPSVVAYGRKEDWEPEQFAAMERIYDNEARRWGLIRLNGTDPASSVSRQVAVAVWQGIR